MRYSDNIVTISVLTVSICFMQCAAFAVGSLPKIRSSIKMSSNPIAWTKATIVSNNIEAIGLRTIEINVGSEVSESYKVAGQYTQIKLGQTKPGFYAIASPPNPTSNTFTFLIKETENNAFLTSTSPGSEVELSLPQGKGYQVTEYFDKYKFDFPVTNVLLMACGSGLAPIAAAIDSGMLGLLDARYNSLYPRKATLYLGVKTLQHIPFQSKFSEWSTKGVKVIPVLSQPSSDWQGYTGYIQDALKEDTVPAPRNCGALLCGQRGMADSVKEILMEAGVFEGRVLSNF